MNELGALFHAALDQLANFFELHSRIDRTDVGILVERITNAQNVDAILQLRHEHLGDRLLHQQSTAGAADVSLIEEDSVDDTLDRLIHGRIVEDDVRCLAPELECQLLVGAGELAHDDLADFGRSGERDLSGGRMSDYRRSRLARSANQVHYSRRKFRLLQ